MQYELRLEGTTVTRVKHARLPVMRNTPSMQRWEQRQHMYDKEKEVLDGVSFTTWLKLLKHKFLIYDDELQKH